MLGWHGRWSAGEPGPREAAGDTASDLTICFVTPSTNPSPRVHLAVGGVGDGGKCK